MDDMMRQEFDALRADLKKVSGDLFALTGRIGKMTMAGAADGLDDLGLTSDEMQARLRQAADEARTTLEQQVRERPLGAVVIALTVGFLLGKSMGRG